MKLAVAGKGGTGKTTFSALLIRYLIEKKEIPILAVDADPNANLNEALGMEVETSIATILQDFVKNKASIPPAMTKEKYVQYQIQTSVVEEEYVDLLVMGGPEGPGCYCYPNDLLKNHLKNLAEGYRHVVMDNEAGLEHLSRRTTADLDLLFIISDGTARGIRSAGRVYSIVRELDLKVGSIYLIINRTSKEEVEILKGEIDKTGLSLLGSIPSDRNLVEYDLHGKPLFQLPEDSPAVKRVMEILDELSIL